jgi:hypothetical protein
MIAFIYRCPRTGQQVQGWAADHLAEGETYEPVTCTACGRNFAIFATILRASSLLSNLATAASNAPAAETK